MKPRKVLIGPHEVEVQYIETLDDAGRFIADPNPVIQLHPKLNPKELALTTLHECIHGIFYFHRIDFSQTLDEERMVGLIESEVPELLRRNKSIFKDLV